VTAKLRDLIVQGAYKEGEQLNEVALASAFGISRGPIREALRQLVHEGLLRSEPHRGAFVPKLTETDIADIYQARLAIETAALEAIVKGGQYSEIANTLLKIAQSMERALSSREWTRLADLDLRFHTELVNGAASVRLSRMYSALVDETRICQRLSTADPEREKTPSEHLELAELLRDGNLAEMRDALSRHLSDSSATLSRGKSAVGELA
jgi:DNA-binding GntR family transcriptional regulator